MKISREINKTEARALLKSTAGKYAERNATIDRINELMVIDDCPNTDQEVVRKKVQSFLQSNWQSFSELLNCNGDCASLRNTCTDAQALVCYRINKKQIDG
jgi:hypothetical protein